MGAAVTPARVAGATGSAIVLLGALGIGFEWRPEPALSPFHLDGEWTVPAIFSSSLLLAAAAALYWLERRSPDRFVRRISYAFCAVLVFAAVDETAQIHEYLERRLEIDWQLLYLPAFVLAAIMWGLLLVNLCKTQVSRALFFASGVAWLASQVLEELQWDGDDPVRGYVPMMVVEELLELIGSAFLLVAVLRAEQELHRTSIPAEPTHRAQPTRE
jgi:hypothetical protein